MRIVRSVWLAAAILPVCSADVPLPGDARLGAKLFREQKCVVCHSINGEGGKAAPDLGKRLGRDYTPATMASLMWNHAPTMWSAMEKQGIEKPKLSSTDAANLFAYFWADRFFDRPGDAGRGKQAFQTKSCAGCHAVDKAGAGPAIRNWAVVSDPIALSAAMWNHMGTMRTTAQGKGLKWPTLLPQEMTDIVVYVQTLPGVKKGEAEFSPASASTGADLFQAKGCAQCHQGAQALEAKPGGRTMNDLAAALWNHGNRLKGAGPQISNAEMRRLVGYLWVKQFFNHPGNASKGKQIFEAKGCGNCHGKGAPDLAKGNLTPFQMVSGLWTHGPEMSKAMAKGKMQWPRFQGAEMSDLLAFLNAK